MDDLQKNRLFILVIAIVALEAILFSVADFKFKETISREEARLEKMSDAIAELELEAKAVSVANVTLHKKIYGKNDTVPMPIASLAKTMTVVTALSGATGLEEMVVSRTAVGQAGDYGLLAGERWTSGDLSKFTLITSANDGAYALGEKYEDFASRMNGKAKRIGMNHGLFLNPTGLDINLEEAGAFASAEDANAMAVYGLLAHPEIFLVTTEPEINLTSLSGFPHVFKNTNIIADKIPNLLFSKTGYTEIAGGNLTVIFRNRAGEAIAVTVLGSTFEGRFTDMERIVNVLYNM